MRKPVTLLIVGPIPAGLVAGLLLGWSLTRPQAAPPSATPPSVASASRTTTATQPQTVLPASPTPVSSTTPTVAVSVQQASKPARQAQLQQVAIGWVTASATIDSTRPYPGLDVTTLEQLATQQAARDLKLRRTEWNSPRTTDQQGWKLLIDQRYRTTVDVSQIYIDGATVTVIYTVTEYRNGRGAVTARNQAMQLQLTFTGSGWKVADVVTNPQSP